MAIIIWSDEFSVQIKTIDNQHKKLIGIINDLHEAMSIGKGKDILGKTLQELITYTQTHFAAEEQLMSTHNYPGAAAHTAEHMALTQKVLELQNEYRHGKIALTVPTMTFLVEWLKKHICEVDKLYSPYLREKGLQ